MDLAKFTPEQLAMIPGVDPIQLRRYQISNNSIYFSHEKVSTEAPYLIGCIIFVVMFFIARFLLKSLILVPIANFFNITSPGVVRKFAESGWYAIYYAVFTCFGCYVLYLEGLGVDHGIASSSSRWSPADLADCWQGWPLQPFPKLYRLYYLMELMFYVHCLIALHLEPRQKDYPQMCVHHAATFGLVFGSYWLRYHRIGLVILITHNISDIFLYGGKCFHYVADRLPRNSLQHTVGVFCAYFVFGIFVLSFFLTRLVFFPFYVISSTYFDSLVIITRGVIEPPAWTFANVCLGILQSLHVFWFYLIIKMIVRITKQTETKFRDERSDSEESDIEDDGNEESDEEHSGARHAAQSNGPVKSTLTQRNMTKPVSNGTTSKRTKSKKHEK